MNVEVTPTFKRETLPEVMPGIFLRAIAANVISKAQDGRVSPLAVANTRWPQDRALADFVVRAASNPATTFTTGWAAELAHQVVADGLTALSGPSAAARLMSMGLVLTWGTNNAISVPGFTASASSASFVAEGSPIPVRQFADTPAVLPSTDLADIAVLTREMIESSNAQQLIGDVLIRSMGLALDVAMFGSAAASLAQPAGLRNGVSATTPSNNADGWEAIAEDTAALVNAIAPVAGTGPYVIVASPGRVLNMASRMDADADDPDSMIVLLPSLAVGNDILAVAPAALASAISPTPTITVNNSASLHMDSVPQAIGSVAPAKSLFQTDSIALKAGWKMSWVLRDPRGVAWLTPVWK